MKIFNFIKVIFNYKNKELKVKQKEIELREKVKYITKKKNFEEKKFYAQNMKNSDEENYKEFVAGYYKLSGYSIYLNRKDIYRGIDIICMKDDIVILIKTLNSKDPSKINNELLKKFFDSCNEYLDKNNLFDKRVKFKYIVEHDILDKLSYKLLKENKILEYRVLNNTKKAPVK